MTFTSMDAIEQTLRRLYPEVLVKKGPSQEAENMLEMLDANDNHSKSDNNNNHSKSDAKNNHMFDSNNNHCKSDTKIKNSKSDNHNNHNNHSESDAKHNHINFAISNNLGKSVANDSFKVKH